MKIRFKPQPKWLIALKISAILAILLILFFLFSYDYLQAPTMKEILPDAIDTFIIPRYLVLV